MREKGATLELGNYPERFKEELADMDYERMSASKDNHPMRLMLFQFLKFAFKVIIDVTFFKFKFKLSS